MIIFIPLLVLIACQKPQEPSYDQENMDKFFRYIQCGNEKLPDNVEEWTPEHDRIALCRVRNNYQP